MADYIPPGQTYGESVLFAFVRAGQVLCEWREWQGARQHSIPGGKIDLADREQADYQRTALLRETWEEFQVTPTRFERVGQIWYGNYWLFHVYMVHEWRGQLPAQVLDNPHPLHWIDPQDLRDVYSMPGIAALIQENIHQ